MQAQAQAAAQPVQPRPEPPPGAQPYDRGPYDAVVLGCAGALIQAVRPTFGPVEVERLQLPAGAAWPQVSGHYARGFTRADGWATEPVPEQAEGCRMRAWSNGGAHFAAAMLDAPVGEPPFRVLILAYPAP